MQIDEKDEVTEPKAEPEPEPEPIEFKEFLETTPPGQLKPVRGLAVRRDYSGGGFSLDIRTPELYLHCPNEYCDGSRYLRFANHDVEDLEIDDFVYLYLTYQCANCKKFQRTFFLAAKVNSEPALGGSCYKFGELPPFGPPTSAKLLKLIGPDSDLFLQGRKCETQGLGIGANAYYRRVVENQKDRIFDQIIKVSKKISVDEDSIKALEKAKAETQFTNALDIAKSVIPESLLIDGQHNPLKLLHGALSEGMHAGSDADCLDEAQSIRVVLADLAERMNFVLKEKSEIQNAVSKLMNTKKK